MHPGDPLPPEALNDMRKRVLNHEPYTKDEFTRAVRTLVGARIAALATPAKKTKTSKELPVHSLDDLL